jgi:hypothetical protein
LTSHWLVLPLALVVVGCVSTAVAVVKAPFQLVGAGVDVMTTSQEEADRNRGRALRKQDEAETKAVKRAEKQRRKDEREAQ